MSYGYVFNTLYIATLYIPTAQPPQFVNRKTHLQKAIQKATVRLCNSRWQPSNPPKIWNTWRKPGICLWIPNQIPWIPQHLHPRWFGSPQVEWKTTFTASVGRAVQAVRALLPLGKSRRGVFWFIPWEVTICNIGWFLFCNAWLE